MNILHMKYAVEVAKCGSINKAAEILLMNQPNLSRAIKELEASLGVEIFSRSAKGMVVTPEGETFLRYATSILEQVDEVEGLFKKSTTDKKKFSISVPRSSYISDAFANFAQSVNKLSDAEIFYKETNSRRTIKNVTENEFKLGIVRYAEHFDKFYKNLFEEKGLSYELITDFSYVLAMNKECPLVDKEIVTFSDLKNFIEIAHADPFVPSLSMAAVKKEELSDDMRRRIFVYERASQFELMARNTQTFMWVSPIPRTLLERYDLVQVKCAENTKVYKDVMVHRNDYHLSELDNIFITELCRSKREIFR